MSWQAVKANFDYLASRHYDRTLRWDKAVVDTFSKLTGSGYIQGSIRSLWPLYSDERRKSVGYLLEMTEHWRDALRKRHVLDDTSNEGFVEATQGFLRHLQEGTALPISDLFSITDGVLQWHWTLPRSEITD
jgi:hypothetical protein